jgi:hypothetical protein
MKNVIGTVFLIASVFIAFMAQAHAEDIKFHILNESPYDIQVRFFSKARTVFWPGQHSGYDQKDHVVHDYSLACNPGEQICYGAWTMPHLADKWGVGDTGKLGCAKCCGVCGQNVSEISLGLAK